VTVYSFTDEAGVERLQATIDPAPGGGLPSWFQSGAGTPVGVVVPAQQGALYQDTTNGALFVATGPLAANWVLIGGYAQAGGGATYGITDAAGLVFISGTNNAGAGTVVLTDIDAANGSGNGVYWTLPVAGDQHQTLVIALGNFDKVFTFGADGSLECPEGVGQFGATPPAAKPATPILLADVIALLQSYGMCQ
jgi:hypothetical protein